MARYLLTDRRDLYSDSARDQRSRRQFAEPPVSDAGADTARHRQFEPRRCESAQALDGNGIGGRQRRRKLFGEFTESSEGQRIRQRRSRVARGHRQSKKRDRRLRRLSRSRFARAQPRRLRRGR